MDDLATRWKKLKDAEVAAQTERRELEDKMKFEGYTSPNLKVTPSLTKYFELTNEQYQSYGDCFKIEYKPDWKLVKENEGLLALVQVKAGRPTFTWKETEENENV
jgi:hypothetical protein